MQKHRLAKQLNLLVWDPLSTVSLCALSVQINGIGGVEEHVREWRKCRKIINALVSIQAVIAAQPHSMLRELDLIGERKLQSPCAIEGICRQDLTLLRFLTCAGAFPTKSTPTHVLKDLPIHCNLFGKKGLPRQRNWIA